MLLALDKEDLKACLTRLRWFLSYTILQYFVNFLVDPYYEPLLWFMITRLEANIPPSLPSWKKQSSCLLYIGLYIWKCTVICQTKITLDCKKEHWSIVEQMTAKNKGWYQVVSASIVIYLATTWYRSLFLPVVLRMYSTSNCMLTLRTIPWSCSQKDAALLRPEKNTYLILYCIRCYVVLSCHNA